MDDAGVGRLVTWQRGNGLLKFKTLHDIENPSHRLGFQESLPAGKDIVLGQQTNEVETELPRRGFDAEGDIGHSAGDISRNRRMGKLDLLGAADLGLIDSMQRKKLVEQKPRSGIMVAVDEAGFAIRNVLDRQNIERISPLPHQPHLAVNKTDDPILARIEPFLAGFDTLLTQFAARQMHAGQIAGALRQRDQRMLVADIAQIDADAGFAVEQFAQFRDSKAVAGMNANDGWALMQERLDLGGEFLREVFQLR